MLVEKNFLSKIRDFGLNTYESKVWIALLSRGTSTAGELSDIANVPRSRSYDVLESLEKKGFVLMKIGKPIQYLSVPPEEIMERVRKSIQADTDISLRMLEEIKGTGIFKDLELLYTTGVEKFESEDICTAILGRENLMHFIKQLIERAEKKVIIATTEEGFSRKLSLVAKALRKSGKKNVKVTIIAPVKESIGKKLGQNIELVCRPTDSRFVVIDNKEMVFTLNDGQGDKQKDCGIWVKSDFFTRGMLTLLETTILRKQNI